MGTTRVDGDPTEGIALALAALRSERKLTLDALARLSGVSRGMLWQVEQGKSAATVKLLARVASALQVPLARLLEGESGQDCVVLRGTDAKVLQSGDGKFSSRALFPYSGTHLVEFYELHIQAGHAESAEAHEPGTVENLVVVEGAATITVGARDFHLSCGDALYFRADVEHTYRSSGDGDTRLFLVMGNLSQRRYG